MNKVVQLLILLLIMAAFSNCSKKDLTEEQVFRSIKKDSIIAKTDYLELKKVSILSSSWADDNFRALLRIDFMNHHDAMHWRQTGRKDFIPTGMQLAKGKNSVKVTATFTMSYTGDASWYIESFTF